MDRRLLLAIALTLIVLLLPQVLFPPEVPPAAPADTSVVADSGAEPAGPVPDRPSAQPSAEAVRQPGGEAERQTPAATADTVPKRAVIVEAERYTYAFTTLGARITGATFPAYDNLTRPGHVPAQLIPDDSDFLRYRLVLGNDTLRFDDWSFTPSADTVRVGPEGAELTWRAARGGVRVDLTYRFDPELYLFDVRGQVSGTVREALMLVDLGPRLNTVDADTAADVGSYAVVTKSNKTESVSFRSLDPGETQVLQGPFEWVAIKAKYFVAALMTLDGGAPRVGGAVVTGGPRTDRKAMHAPTTISLPAPGGVFQFSFYAGPQEYRRLARIGHDFEDVNPYGWIFRPIIRPVANFIVRIMLWVHETLNLAYGWVLILFGVAIRVLLWPLYRKSMQSSMAMQAIQPEMKALQERYGKKDPQKLQQEMLKLYREHGVNPLGGCLPMLLPMPILFALFFVFANTIEFRGVPFLWLPDLSRADPLYIIPVLMGASMFVVSKIGQRGMPDNPQAKMIMYIMPPMLTLLFLRFSAGLNLYYAVSNIAGIPQQWIVSKERMRRMAQRKVDKDKGEKGDGDRKAGKKK